jgi:asparagine synthetase B (glutamine-hydrolysing)
MSPDQDFFGDLYEAHRNGSTITKGNPLKLPRYGNIYNFNQFKAKDGTTLSVVISGDGYLTVYNQEKKEMWHSNDRFGGSNLYFEREDQQNVRSTGELYRKVFLGMRIQVTAKNEVVVGRNEGTFVVGNVRFYKKGSVYCFQWDGSSLEELWRTREVQNYMPDYRFDEARSELLLLQMPQRPGPGEEGAASLAIKKVE